MFFYTGLILIRITYLRSVHMYVNRNVIPSEGWIEFHCVHIGRTLSIQPPAMDAWAASTFGTVNHTAMHTGA